MSDKRRVVITGLGLITPVGLDVTETWDSLVAGVSGAAPITRFDASGHAVRFACEVKGFDPEVYMDRKEVRRADRFLQLAIGAAQQAAEQAGLPESVADVDAERFGVIVGSGIGGLGTLETQHSRMLDRGPDRVSPFFIPMFIGDMAAGMISMRYVARGPNYATVSACASSGHAVGAAFRSIRTGETDVMITGGTEATVTPLCVAGFASMKALSERNESPETASRPFDATRDGFVLGEGAGMLVLESEEHALARGATGRAHRIRAERGRVSHDVAGSGGRRGADRDAPRVAGLRTARRGHRVHQRSRHVHAGQRLYRNGGNQVRVRRSFR